MLDALEFALVRTLPFGNFVTGSRWIVWILFIYLKIIMVFLRILVCFLGYYNSGEKWDVLHRFLFILPPIIVTTYKYTLVDNFLPHFILRKKKNLKDFFFLALLINIAFGSFIEYHTYGHVKPSFWLFMDSWKS